MAFTYTGNPLSSPRDKYRFMLSDTNPDEPILTDAEIDFIIADANGDETKLLYDLFSRAATTFAREIKRSLGPQHEDPTQRTKFFQDKANEYKALLSHRGMGQSKNAYPKIFRKGMQSNPRWPKSSTGADNYYV